MSDTNVDPNQSPNLTGGIEENPPPQAQPKPAKTITAPPLAPNAPPPVPQRFTPNATRGHDNWGDPNWSIRATESGQELGDTTFMPSPEEAWGVAHGASRQLGNWGPRSLAPQYNLLAMMARGLGSVVDWYSHGAFWKSFNSSSARALEAQRQQQEMQREQFYDLGMQTIAQHKGIMQRFRRVFQELESKKGPDGTWSPEAMEEAKQQIRTIAGETNHTNILHYLDNNDFNGLRAALDAEDAKLIDDWSAILAIGNTRTGRGSTVKEESDLGKAIEGKDVTPGGVSLPGGPARPAPQQADPQSLSADFDKELEQKYAPFGPTGVAMAHDLYNTDKAGGLSAASLRTSAGAPGGKVVAAAEDIRNRISQIANGQAATDEKLKQIEKVDPTAARNIESLRDYDADPKAVENKRYVGLAHSVDRSFKEEVYPAVAEFYRQNRETLTAVRGSTLSKDELNVLNALKDIPENVKIPFRYGEQIETFIYSGDPKYSNLNQAIQDMILESSAVQTATGVPRVQIIQNLREHFKSSMSPAQIRGAMQILGGNSYKIVEALDNRWKSITGKATHMPGFDEESAAIQRGIGGMNAYTGEVPTRISDGRGGVMDTPNALKSVSKSPPTDPNKRPDYVTDKKAKPPLNQDQIDAAKQWLKDHPNDPRAEAIIRELGINQ